MKKYTDEQRIAVRETLQKCLVYEGGEMQSMSEMFGCASQNSHILKVAKDLNIKLDLSEVGRD